MFPSSDTTECPYVLVCTNLRLYCALNLLSEYRQTIVINMLKVSILDTKNKKTEKQGKKRHSAAKMTFIKQSLNAGKGSNLCRCKKSHQNQINTN